MEERGLSQSELARRIGVSQASIYRLVAGEAYGSKHLHKIARELGTTPAFLSGETDDPQSDTILEPTLSFDERALLKGVRGLAPADRRAVQQLVRSLAGANDEISPTVHNDRQLYRVRKEDEPPRHGAAA